MTQEIFLEGHVAERNFAALGLQMRCDNLPHKYVKNLMMKKKFSSAVDSDNQRNTVVLIADKILK
jgi:hypothetical protein